MTIAGQLRERIEIQVKSVSRNAYGEEVISWSTTATLWAQVKPESGREYLQAGQMHAERRVLFKLRYQPGLTITPDMRVYYRSRAFNIAQVVDVYERRRVLHIVAEERV